MNALEDGDPRRSDSPGPSPKIPGLQFSAGQDRRGQLYQDHPEPAGGYQKTSSRRSSPLSGGGGRVAGEKTRFRPLSSRAEKNRSL